MLDYSNFITDEKFNLIPNINIPIENSDIYVIYTEYDRLDRFSNDYYSNPLYGKLILMANPEYKKESDIPPNSIIRIPLSLESAKQRYFNSIEKLNKF